MAQATTSEVRSIARLATKKGGYVHLDAGPELNRELEARLGRRHNLGLRLNDFDVIFSTNIEDGEHINIEEGIA